MKRELQIDDTVTPRVRQRRAAVARSRDWHDQRRAAGRPEPRNADAAIAEAAAFVLSVPRTTVPSIDVLALIDTATLMLQRDGFARVASRNLVIDRLRPRREHRDVFAVPNSTGLVNENLVRQPSGRSGRAWELRDFESLRSVVERLWPEFGER